MKKTTQDIEALELKAKVAQLEVLVAELKYELEQVMPAIGGYDPNRRTAVYLTDERVYSIGAVLAKAAGV